MYVEFDILPAICLQQLHIIEWIKTRGRAWNLLLARLMGQFCFARWRLLSVVVCNAVGGRASRARGRSAAPAGWHCTVDQYNYVPLGRHLV